MSCIYLVIWKQALNKLRKNPSRLEAAFHQNSNIYHGHNVCIKCKLCGTTAKGEHSHLQCLCIETRFRINVAASRSSITYWSFLPYAHELTYFKGLRNLMVVKSKHALVVSKAYNIFIMQLKGKYNWLRITNFNL